MQLHLGDKYATIWLHLNYEVYKEKKMEKEYSVFEESDPGLVEAAQSGEVNACYYLSGIYLGAVGKYGAQYFDPQKAVFWAEKCRESGTEEGLFYYANMLSLLGHIERKSGAFDEKTLNYYLSVRNTLIKLQNSNYDQSKVAKLYFENELDLGWILVSVSTVSFYDPDSAKVHFNNAYEIVKCSDVLWGLGIVALKTDDYRVYFEYGIQAINTNDWFDEEMHTQCLRMMGLVLKDDSFSFVGIKKDLERSYEYMSKAAELGDKRAQQELVHYKRGLFGQIKYIE